MHAGAAVLLDKLRHRAVCARGLQQFHPALADVERAVADAHVLDVLFRIELRPEPLLEERLRFVEVLDGQRDSLDTLDIIHARPLDRVSATLTRPLSLPPIPHGAPPQTAGSAPASRQSRGRR